jgi:tRNA1(Val) A37 N6-methylase TrmN6
VRKVEELGNGAAYLLLLAAVRPGSVRVEKVHRQPVGYHQVTHNLRLLATTFEKLGLGFKVEVDKLAQMKYQDNFYLAAYLHKLAHQPVATITPTAASQ